MHMLVAVLFSTIQKRNEKFRFQMVAQNPNHSTLDQLLTIWNPNVFSIRALTVMTKQFISELKQMDQKTIKNYMFKCAN